MKTRAIFLLAMLFCGLSSYGQNTAIIDSLKSALNQSEGVEQVDVLQRIAWEYRKSHPDSTIYFSQKAIESAETLNLGVSVSKSLNYLGVAYHYKGENIKSFDYYTKAKEMSIEEKDSSQYGHALNSLGRSFLIQGDYVKSFNHYIEAVKTFKEINDLDGLGYGYKSLSELYQTQSDWPKALEMSQKALEIRQETNNIGGRISSLIELAVIYELMGNFQKAFEYYIQAKVNAESIDDYINIARIDLGIAKLRFNQGKYDEALIFANKAMATAGGTTNYNLINLINLELGKAFYVKGDFKSAKKYFQDILKQSDKAGELELEKDAYYFLSEIGLKENKPLEAYNYFMRYDDIQNKLNSAEASRTIAKYESRIEIENRERENQLLKANQARDQAIIERRGILNMALAVVIIVVTILLATLWYTSRKRRSLYDELSVKNDRIGTQGREIAQQNIQISEQNVKLQKRNNQLAKLNNEKDTLMNIVAHDLKSPFNRIHGLTELLKLTGLDEEQGNYVNLLQDISLSSVHLIGDLLDVSAFEIDERKTIVSKIDVSEVLIDKAKSFYADAKGKSIEIKTDITGDNLFLESDQVYLSRILDNLISNAIKFSDPNSKVILSTGIYEEGIFISVKDFGQGFSEVDKGQLYQKFKKLSAQPTAGESSNGLGLAIVKTLVDRLDADIELVSEPNKGSEFILRFPANVEVLSES